MPTDQHDSAGRGLSRRHLLLGGAAAGIGAASALAIDGTVRSATSNTATTSTASTGTAATGTAPAASDATATATAVPFYGTHQAGIETPPQAHTAFIALDLREGVDAAAIARLMRVLTDDAARLTQGAPALADTEPELATVAAQSTVTFGFGRGLVERAGGPQPGWLGPLPAFGIDRLEESWNGGDLLIQLGSNDPVALAHTRRMLLKDARTFAAVRWSQLGFRRAVGSERAGTTMRNLFGQLDGTANPVPGSDDFDRVVWAEGDNPPWLHGGTGFVLRRIAMDLDRWDQLDRPGREQTVGRKLSNGAPLTGSAEHDEPNFAAKNALGFPAIPDVSHLRRARSDDPAHRIFRRGYNYDDAPGAGGVSASGLLFASFQADVAAQFVPIQQRLDALDLLNQWTTPIGSAVFAIPPGCQEGGYIGETLV